MVVNAVVCVVDIEDGKKVITSMMKMSWDTAIDQYHGREGYYIASEKDDLPYPVKRKSLRNVIHQSKSQV